MSTRPLDKRIWLGAGAAAAVVIVLLGWFLAIDPELSAASSIREEADTARTQNTVLEARNEKLKAQNDDAAALRASLVAAVAALPSDDGLPAFTRQLSAQATATSVVLNGIVVGAAVPVAGATGSASDTATPATTEVAGLVQMTITLAANGLGGDLLAFLTEIQVAGPRRALVTASQIAPSGDGSAGLNGPCTLNLTLNIFSAPTSPEAQAALEKLLSGN